MSKDTSLEEEYPMGYSMEWYLHKYKEHELNRTSTEERNNYWREKNELDKRKT